MATDVPGPGAGPDQPEPAAPAPNTPEPAAPAPAHAPEPAWTTPPPAAPSGGTGPASWGGAPQSSPPPQPAWGAPAPQAPQPQPGPQQAGPWGAPAPQAPHAPQGGSWGQGPQPQPGPEQAGQWGAPAPQAPQPQPGTPQPQQPTWGGQAPQAPQPQPQPGPWGTPASGTAYNAVPPTQPPQQGWGAPGQPQPGWQGTPPAKSSGNGCLKACLIVGAILVVLAIIAFIALFAAGSSFVGGLGIDSNGNLKDCGIVSSQQLQTVLGPDAEAHPLSGLANSTVGITLDKRVLPDADNCYMISGASDTASPSSGGYGRIAKHSGGDAASVFDSERAKAQSGQYFATDVPGAGDQAFCTGWSEAYPATGALVRKGNDLVYVSLLIGSNFGDLNFNLASADNGVAYSQDACNQAVAIAELALH
jgi:hypothetical protein